MELFIKDYLQTISQRRNNSGFFLHQILDVARKLNGNIREISQLVLENKFVENSYSKKKFDNIEIVSSIKIKICLIYI